MIIGRRRVGKTLYFLSFVAKKNETLFCEEFVLEIKSKLNIPIFGTINLKNFLHIF